MSIDLWSKSEIRTLRSLAKQNLSAHVIAKKMKRGHAAVRYKACKLVPPVKFRSINRTK